MATTFDSRGNMVDTTASMATDAITAGVLSGRLAFETATDTPGSRDTATVTFTTAGRVQAA